MEIYCEAGAEILPITPEHAIAIGNLPWHHRDPFDQMLIAQAMQENLTIITSDEMFSRYEVTRIW